MDLFKLRDEFSQDGIILCFNGPFSHSIIEEIGTAIRNHLSAENSPPMAVQDVFAIYIEMSQNARNYLFRRNMTCESGSATILIARQDDAYVVTSGNVILNEDVDDLRLRIDHINALDRDGLKKLIRQQLRAEVAPGALGAGIGLMEMAKRSSGRLEYSLRDIDGQHTFFTLKALV
ncbi:SiaB family protein kinase [Geobacter sp. SVR]|uniref:SiaB family protein kinase n=1 Tax=Geobacter sp. SVR TaxID=2495594 RepID=UPI00143F01E3|nr:SiaB family protein kinase [Geobacter sp. SVR]BCS52304.1 hypothetical protein GSVR_06120 [Geobacter sp. SVR]GCF85037.1 hypothetical protein GSbR_16370 [Geobacter sp. SVR]